MMAAASSEQATGVAQINTAMAQLGQATQQAASASEGLAENAEHMSEQAQQLKQLMGFFEVNSARPAARGGPRDNLAQLSQVKLDGQFVILLDVDRIPTIDQLAASSALAG